MLTNSTADPIMAAIVKEQRLLHATLAKAAMFNEMFDALSDAYNQIESPRGNKIGEVLDRAWKLRKHELQK